MTPLHRSPIALHRSTLPTPLGDLVALWDIAALHALHFADPPSSPPSPLSSPPSSQARRDATCTEAAPPSWLRDPIEAYWAGDLRSLHAIPCVTHGTPFQESVWQALRMIPAGETRSYGALAARIGRPTASRAVGAANGANPISLVVPCHRAIGSSGALTGYAHGLERKRWLLFHEGARIA